MIQKRLTIAALLAAVLLAIVADLLFSQKAQAVMIFITILGLCPLIFDFVVAARHKRLDLGFPIIITVIILLILASYLTAAVFVLLILSGELFREYIYKRVQDSIRDISRSLPDTAWLKREQPVEVKISEIKKGETVIVKSGGRVPVDGILQTEMTAMDESVITGESRPIEKKRGATLVAGSINLGDYLEMIASDVSTNSTIAQLHKLVDEAKSKNAPLSRFTTHYAEVTSLVALFSTIILFLVRHNLYQALALWVALVPMIFAIIVPVATTVGISLLAKRGILVKHAAALENLTKITTIVFDKTGTLTKGTPELQEIIALGEFTQPKLLQVAASTEQFSEHELARPIIEKAASEELPKENITEPHVVEGRGITAKWGGKIVAVGNRQLLIDEKIPVSSQDLATAEAREENGSTAIFVAIGGQLAGIIFLADQLRSEAKTTINNLRHLGLKTAMLTGDAKKVADKIAGEIGIDQVRAELSPQDKISIINQGKDTQEKIAMVGDGINDAPALAGANVGIAMGLEGVELALDSAGVVLVNNNLSLLPDAIVSSKKIFRVIKTDLVVASAIHFGVALLVIFNVIGILGSALFHQLSSAVVLINTMRLFSINKRS